MQSPVAIGSLSLMARLAGITLEDYERLTIAFKATPAAMRLVVDATGIPRHLVMRAWHKGWRTLGLAPIRDLLALPPEEAAKQEAEQIATAAAKAVERASQTAEGVARRLVEDATARAVLEATAEEAARAAKERIRRESREAKEQAEARSEARDDAVGVLDEERKLRKGGRAVAGQNIVASARWGRAHSRLAEALLVKVEQEVAGLTAMEIAELSRVMAQVDRARTSLLREAIELERLHRGDPSVIVGVTPTEMSPEEAIREIEEATADLQRFKRQTLAVIDGEGGRSVGPLIDVTPGQ